jgi:hypothetical protein
MDIMHLHRVLKKEFIDRIVVPAGTSKAGGSCASAVSLSG